MYAEVMSAYLIDDEPGRLAIHINKKIWKIDPCEARKMYVAIIEDLRRVMEENSRDFA